MNNLKALMEKRDELKKDMENLVGKADAEARAMSDEETAAFDAAEREIRAIDETNCQTGAGQSVGQPLDPAARRGARS